MQWTNILHNIPNRICYCNAYIRGIEWKKRGGGREKQSQSSDFYHNSLDFSTVSSSVYPPTMSFGSINFPSISNLSTVCDRNCDGICIQSLYYAKILLIECKQKGTTHFLAFFLHLKMLLQAKAPFACEFCDVSSLRCMAKHFHSHREILNKNGKHWFLRGSFTIFAGDRSMESTISHGTVYYLDKTFTCYYVDFD